MTEQAVSYRVMLRNGRDDAFPEAERALLLLGQKVLGESSWMPSADGVGVDLIGLRFVAPGFRRQASDAPVEEQQDGLVRSLFEGGSVRRERDSVSVLSRAEVLGAGQTWDDAFRLALPSSRALPEFLRSLAADRGRVRVLADALSSDGLQRMASCGLVAGPLALRPAYLTLEAPGAPREPQVRHTRPAPSPSSGVAKRGPAKAPPAALAGLATDEEVELYLDLRAQGLVQQARELELAIVENRAALMEAEERELYEDMLAAGETKLARDILLAVVAERLR